MGTIPDLATVRGYVRVPASSLSDDDLERMRAACLEDQTARCAWPGVLSEAVVLAVDDMTATLAIRSGPPGRTYRISWGVGPSVDVVTDASGNATAEHTYALDGAYPATVRTATGDVLGSAIITVPSQSTEAAITYPDSLAQALLRRVQREIAARNLPLGMVGLDAEYGPANIPAFDALIEHHERAWRRVVIA